MGRSFLPLTDGSEDAAIMAVSRCYLWRIMLTSEISTEDAASPSAVLR